jgi:hypothetical protein
MATVWDEAAHLCLLQAVVVNGTFTKEDWAKILQYTKDRGYDYTESAAMYLPPFTYPQLLSPCLYNLLPATSRLHLSLRVSYFTFQHFPTSPHLSSHSASISFPTNQHPNL